MSIFREHRSSLRLILYFRVVAAAGALVAGLALLSFSSFAGSDPGSKGRGVPTPAAAMQRALLILGLAFVLGLAPRAAGAAEPGPGEAGPPPPAQGVPFPMPIPTGEGPGKVRMPPPGSLSDGRLDLRGGVPPLPLGPLAPPNLTPSLRGKR